MTDRSPRKTRLKQGDKIVVAVVIAAVLGTNVLILSKFYLPWIGPALGFLLALGLPAWMLSQKINWWTKKPSERLACSVVAAILALMLLGLVINTTLPYLGLTHPLDRVPMLIGIDIWCAALALWRWERFRPSLPNFHFDRLRGIDWLVGILAALCPPAAVIGANRLNNGAGGGVTLGMLMVAGLVFTLMLIKSEQFNSGTVTAAIYFIGLAMLLMTSLRGWYITGHDVQQEYRVFELTKSHDDWSISLFQDPYNACLSITILPTMIWQLVRVYDPYVYKVFFQVLFALCPVFVYNISLRYTSRPLAIIATVFFVSFPTYFTDMPFLNRQEIAFLFVGACVLMATNSQAPRRKARLWLGIFSVGIVLSHYSTSYVFFGTLALGWLSYRAWYVLARIRQRKSPPPKTRLEANSLSLSPAVSLLNVFLVLGGIILWNGIATHTLNGLGSTLSQAIDSFRGGVAGEQKSADVSYSLFSIGTPSESQLLAQYDKNTLAQTSAGRKSGVYYSVTTISAYPIKLIPDPNLPVTTLGRWFGHIGVNVATVNSISRAGAAKFLQLLVAVGLLTAIVSRRRSRSFVEFVTLASAAVIIVALQVILPVISVDYGILRAFLQALIVFGPLVAIGSSIIFKPLGQKWSLRAASATAILFFLSLTGVFPQVLGGYPAQLHLNDSGGYYDNYYVHPQEIAAVEWLQAHISASSIGEVQSAVETDPYTYTEVRNYTDIDLSNDFFPALLRQNAYVFLGYATVTEDRASFSYDGDVITYQYPMGLLDSTKNLIYSSNGTRIYQ